MYISKKNWPQLLTQGPIDGIHHKDLCMHGLFYGDKKTRSKLFLSKVEIYFQTATVDKFLSDFSLTMLEFINLMLTIILAIKKMFRKIKQYLGNIKTKTPFLSILLFISTNIFVMLSCIPFKRKLNIWKHKPKSCK